MVTTRTTYRAVPVIAADCVPAESVTETVAVFVPAVSVDFGRNCTVTVHELPFPRVVEKPQLESSGTIE